VLTRAVARVGDLRLEADGGHVPGPVVQLRVAGPPGQRLQIPQDLLAVLGWHWRPLFEYSNHWRGTLRVAKREPRRSQQIEARMRDALSHLGATLTAAPAAFHERHRRARWRVTFQRALPLLVGLGIIAATPAAGQFFLEDDASPLRMLIFHGPPLMLLGLFMLSELPRIEIPPPPRRLRHERWLAARD
jgi:hypothetical protein